MPYIRFHDVIPYKRSFELSNMVWDIVRTWDYFAQKTIGAQLVESIDSISANIAEGFGRYNKKEKIHFYRYAMGSLYEAINWIDKALKRKLLSPEQHTFIRTELLLLPKEINTLIKITNNKLTV